MLDKNIAIQFNGVGKQYRLGLVGTGSLQHDLNRWWQTSILGKEDPYLKIGEVNDRTSKGESDYVWALKDINFKVEQGDVVGIIGKNGAGKSTLLKLLSHITAPSTGTIDYRGRIASLLEVGTGFHPEMTGRQNIYMNGSIMGMTKHEINRKLDEIVDFAGVERYLDTPVKRYSSGMTVRLGFAVAAFLEPEILVVDEVLTVGDAEFQKKAIGKMNSVAKTGGRTVLFVSHNMASVKKLCNSGILLQNGMLKSAGPIKSIVEEYIGGDVDITGNLYFNDLQIAPGNETIRIVSSEIFASTGEHVIDVSTGILFRLKFQCNRADAMLDVNLTVKSLDDTVVFWVGRPLGEIGEKDSVRGIYTIEYVLPPFTLNSGKYRVDFTFGENQRYLIFEGFSQTFEVENYILDKGYSDTPSPGYIRPRLDFNINCEPIV